MGLKVKTSTLQEMVSRAVKGAGNNKMIPLTSLISIELVSGNLSITTTDATNYLTIQQEKVAGDDFQVVVQADLFHKLVGKTSSETIELNLHDSKLEFVGNGRYVIELPLDETGAPVQFPKYHFDWESTKSVVKLSTFKLILSVNKAALADTMEEPCYTGYYFGDSVITTDTFKICNTATKVFENTILLPAELVHLLSVMTEETIYVQQDGDRIVFSTNDCIIFGQAMDCIDRFAAEAISGLAESEFPSSCKLPRQELVAVLDRIGLFVTQYDRNGLDLLFTNEGLKISSKQSTGAELIKYASSQNFQPFSAPVDIQMFRAQVAAQNGETLELYYGVDTAIKMKTGIVTQVVALLDDEVADIEGVSAAEDDGSIG